jgi:hypothetical protein
MALRKIWRPISSKNNEFYRKFCKNWRVLLPHGTGLSKPLATMSLAMKLLAFMELWNKTYLIHKCLITRPCPEPVQTSSNLTDLSNTHFNIILPFKLGYLKFCLYFQVFRPKSYFIIYPCALHVLSIAICPPPPNSRRTVHIVTC